MGAEIVTGRRQGLDRESVESATLYMVVKDTRAAPGTHQTATGGWYLWRHIFMNVSSTLPDIKVLLV